MTFPCLQRSYFPVVLLLSIIHQAKLVIAADYLYSVLSPEESFPVIEYEPNATDATDQYGPDDEHPKFLYSSKQGHRLVLFYLPWCPHCQAYVPTYIGLARRMREITTAHNLPAIDFFAMSCSPNKNICKDQHVSGVPGIKIFPAGSTEFTAVNPLTLHPFQILRTLDVFVGANFEEEEKEAGETAVKVPQGNFRKGKNPATSRAEIHESRKIIKRNKVDLYADAYRSFHFAMKTEVYMNGPLQEKPRAALGAWLLLLQNTVPTGWRLQKLLLALLVDFDAVVKDERKLLKILDRYPPPPGTSPGGSDWSPSCSNGDEDQGYTCGLWELFHIVTVGTVEYNENAISTDPTASLHTAAVGQTLRNYIEHFFSCEVCRAHFLKAYDDCTLDRCHRLVDTVGEQKRWIQLPLWLAEEHNAVSHRLMLERVERSNNDLHLSKPRPEEAAAWPPPSDCPMCWNVDGTLNGEVAYLYLLKAYWYVVLFLEGFNGMILCGMSKID